MSGRHASPRQTPKRGRGTNTGPAESPQTWSSNDKRIEQQLGPMWSLSETTTFFNAVKQGRNDWDGIASKLTGKTPENLMNLYKMYKSYLELPEASALALFTILQSVYSMPGLLGGDDDSNMRRTRSKTVTPKPNNKDNNSNNSTNTTPKTPATKPVVRRTRKQLFPDDTPTTPKRGGTSNAPSSSSSSSSSTLRTPSPLKSTPSRKRKTGRHDSPPVTPIRTTGSTTTTTTTTGGMNTPSATLASTPDSQLPLKLRGKVWKGKISPLRQDGSKNTPTHSSQQSADTLQSHKIIHDRLVNFFSSRSPKTQNKHEVALSAAGRWAVYEWFYSDIDRAYFHVNDFQDCLNDLGLSKIRKLTRVEWAHVRSAMGKPRRLSRAFLKQERCKLYNTRANVRSMRIGEPPSTSTAADAGLVPQEIPQSLAVGAKVLGYHHKALKKGVVQSSDSAGSKYRVAFEGHSTSLWIKDVDLMSLYDEYEDDDPRRETPATSKRRKVLDMTPNGAHNHGENNNLKTPLSSQNRTYTRPELVNIASLVTLLDRKDDLLAELTAMNNQAEKMLAQSQEYPGWFQQRYAVLIVKLDEVNRRLEPALVLLHASRSSPPSHTPTIARTFTDISMLDFREQNWGETAISECRLQSQALVKEHMNAFSVNSLMRDYVAECVCLLLQLRACASHVQLVGPEEATPDVITSLDYLLSTVKPKSEENMALFSEIEQSVNMLKTKLTSSRSIPSQNYTNIAT